MRVTAFIISSVVSFFGTLAHAQDAVGALSFGLGIDEKREAVAQITLQTRRAFDRDVFANIELEASASSRQAAASIAVPGLFGDAPSVGIDLGYQQTDGRGTFAFDQTRAKVELFASFADTPLGQIEAFYAARQAKISGVAATGSAVLQADVGTRTSHALGYRWGLSLGDASGEYTQARITFTQEAEWASDNRRLYRSQFGFGVRSAAMGPARLSFGMQAGVVAASGGGTRVEDRFYLGPNDIRGFALAGIGPRDLSAGNAALGGNMFTTARLDLKFPGVMRAAPQITPGLFVDAGALWALDSVAGGAAGANPVDAGASLRASAGVSFAWEMGPGSLRLDFSQPLKSQAYDVVQNVQLGFQTTF